MVRQLVLRARLSLRSGSSPPPRARWRQVRLVRIDFHRKRLPLFADPPPRAVRAAGRPHSARRLRGRLFGFSDDGASAPPFAEFRSGISCDGLGRRRSVFHGIPNKRGLAARRKSGAKNRNPGNPKSREDPIQCCQCEIVASFQFPVPIGSWKLKLDTGNIGDIHSLFVRERKIPFRPNYY